MVQQEAEALGRRVRKATVRADMLMRVLAAVGLRLTVESRDRAWSPRTSRPG